MRAIALRTPAGFLAFGMGSGLFRRAPGTAGTVLAVPLALALSLAPGVIFWSSLAAAFGVGVYLCEVTSRRMGQTDPGGIVWDEIVGFCLATSLIPENWAWWLLAFGLFRLFDIFKPWPIRWFERHFKGGLGIMIDDALAAVYTMIAAGALQRVLAMAQST